MTHLSHEEKMEYTKVFLVIDAELGNGEGKLDIKAFEKYLIMCGYRISKERVAEVFCRADIDGNWKITLDEFLAGLPNLAPQGSPEARGAAIRRRFEENDTNHDGFLTFDELCALMGGIQDDQDALKELVKCMIDKWDEDGDGKINFEEFLTLYLEADLNEEDFEDEDEDEMKQDQGKPDEEAPEEPKDVSSAKEEAPEEPKDVSSAKEEAPEEPKDVSSAKEEAPEKPNDVSSAKEEAPEKPTDVSSTKEEEPEKPKDVSSCKNVKDRKEEKNSCSVERKDASGAVNVKSMAARWEKKGV